jgi:hypothetical protein
MAIPNTGEERVPSGHYGVAVSDPQVAGFTSGEHGSASRDDKAGTKARASGKIRSV